MVDIRIDRNSSHSGRRPFAARLIFNGQSVETVQILLGYAHLDHVSPYLDASARSMREGISCS